ncbi:MAG: hypothetical protein GX642_10375 [Smithella sp.]|nr:hypothetical protein [Smithella sp.]
MGNKSDESRDSYNQIAFKYDTSKEGRYIAFHIEELVNIVELKENDVVLDVACGEDVITVTQASMEKDTLCLTNYRK